MFNLTILLQKLLDPLESCPSDPQFISFDEKNQTLREPLFVCNLEVEGWMSHLCWLAVAHGQKNRIELLRAQNKKWGRPKLLVRCILSKEYKILDW